MAACKAGDAFIELAPEHGGHFGASVLAPDGSASSPLRSRCGVT